MISRRQIGVLHGRELDDDQLETPVHRERVGGVSFRKQRVAKAPKIPLAQLAWKSPGT
jgi:hypothetical protein